MPKATQRQFLIRVSGVDGFFSNKTGGNTAGSSTDVWDGGSLTPEKLSAPAVTDDVVVGRPFDPARDRSVLRRLRPQVGRLRTTVTVQDLDGDLVATSDPPTTYADALLVGVNEPEADAASGNAAMFELHFAVSTVA